ncbi:signal peptidase i [Haloferax mucosum ATCC BAA-1512]|uniref:Signal peptidase i n=1 Tax=Haloferax mucosum ATCC BAA-1512 TaxID=662479 RepID=M0IKS2_9EURY|nr:S26 family signal peptidase [Haloferax mucosum]ELZ96453.1 signal peptidase i [Haloferax mucosum ATCC BAA-1512]
MISDRTLQAVAAGVGFVSLYDFLGWFAPHAFVGMQLLALVLPVGVAAPTGSMQPLIDGGDRLVHDEGFGDISRGDVVIYDAPDAPRTGLRVLFHVEAGENWYDRADPQFLGDATGCEELANCPAPNAGWITKGDNNPRIDQAAGRHGPVREEWVEGRVVAIVDDDGLDITWLGA